MIVAADVVAGLRRRTPDRLVDGLLVVALAGLTWVVVLLGVGVLLRLRPTSFLSVLSLLSLVAIVVMGWPVIAIRPWRPGGGARVRWWLRGHRTELAVTAGLLVFVASPVRLGPLESVLSLLRLPFRAAAGFLFSPSLVYQRVIAPEFGRGLFRFAQWYLEVIILYFVASLVLDGVRSLRREADA